MWIVRLALRRPYTFIVMSLVIIMMGVASIRRTPTDIFPNIDIPVISVVWTYNGLSTEEMERQITTFSEFSTSFAVSNIKNIESQTTNGVAVIKIYFQPNVDISAATAQVTGVAQTILRRMPPGPSGTPSEGTVKCQRQSPRSASTTCTAALTNGSREVPLSVVSSGP